MPSPYIVVDGDINNLEDLTIIGIHGSQYQAEDAAEEYAKRFSNSTVHIFEWRTGSEAKTIVNVEKLWYSGYIAPVQPAPEVPDAPTAMESLNNGN